jgi:hypothetical protein
MENFRLRVTHDELQNIYGLSGLVFLIGQMQISVPKAITKPPIHIQMTSGRTSALSVAWF